MRPWLPLLSFAFALGLAAPSTAATPDFWCGAADLNGDGTIGAPDFLKFGQCWQQPPPGTPPAGFLGFSTATINGFRGQLRMNGLCVDTFGAGAFMCPTTALALQSPPAGITGNGWVQAVLAATSLGNSGFVVEVVTGASAPVTAMSCNAWLPGVGGTGFVLSLFDGSFSGGGSPDPAFAEFAGFRGALCTEAHPVACCRLP